MQGVREEALMRPKAFQVLRADPQKAPCPKGNDCALNRGAIHCFHCGRNWPPDETWAPRSAYRAETERGNGDLCTCGHPRDRHWMGLGQPGTCQCQIDKRHPSQGGDTLWPCPCKGFVSVHPIHTAGRYFACHDEEGK